MNKISIFPIPTAKRVILGSDGGEYVALKTDKDATDFRLVYVGPEAKTTKEEKKEGWVEVPGLSNHFFKM